MSDVLAKEIINELCGVFTEAGLDASVEDVDGSDVLAVNYDDGSEVEDGNVIITHYDDILTVFDTATIWSGLEGKERTDIAALVPYMNRFLDIGSICLDDESGDLEFKYSFIAIDTIDREKLLKIISVAYGTAESTAAEAAGITAPVLSGEKPVSGLLNEESEIIQF